jgi:hypothetical protein
MPELVGVSPARIGAEVSLPNPERDFVKGVGSDWGSSVLIQLDPQAPWLDFLGVVPDMLVIGEVKNMEGVGGPADLKLGELAERAGALARLLKEDPGYVAALVSAFNGGGIEGGRVSSAFSARPSLAVLKVGDPRDVPVKFVADRGRAAFFIFDTTLGKLMDVNYLNNVAERIYGVYKNIESYSRSLYGTVEDVVDSVIDRYSSYSPVVKLLK